MPGPTPKHPSVRARRNDPKKGFTSLPAGGREGEAPPWPLQPPVTQTAQFEIAQDRIACLQVEIAGEVDGRKKGRLSREMDRLELTVATLRLQIEQSTELEVAVWNELWRTPQAVRWEESHAHREVAGYVRWKVMAEQGDLKAAAAALGLSDRLGLTPLSLHRLQLEIERAQEAEDRGTERRTRTAKPRPKDGDDPRSILRAVN